MNGDDHEWQASVSQRSKGHGCGVCANRVVVKSNCLATLNPELAKEWHPTKNAPYFLNISHMGQKRWFGG